MHKFSYIHTGFSLANVHSTPALVGFNSGDGRSYSLPQSNPDEIINITMTTNVDIPGVWMFRVDLTEVTTVGMPSVMF